MLILTKSETNSSEERKDIYGFNFEVLTLLKEKNAENVEIVVQYLCL